MPEKVAPPQNRLARQTSESFCGREAEVAALLEILAPDGPLVSFLHGIPGLGKSTILSHFAEQATAQGAQVTTMDCRVVEPTAAGFLAAWGQLIGVELKDLATAAQITAEQPAPVVLCLDNYETLLLLDTWLRQTLMPVMADNFRLIMASRRPPIPLWLTAPGWQGLFSPLALAPLPESAARQLLAGARISPEQCDAIINQTHGNPLALKMAAAAMVQSSVNLQNVALQDVMQELAGLFLAEVADPATRDALSKASVARRITRSLLRALPDVDEEQFENLRHLPFVDTWPDGLRLHDAVRDAIAGTLRANDPECYFTARRCTWSQLRDEVRITPRSELWRSTADMLFLIENPVIREAFFPSSDQDLAVVPAQPSDWMQIRDIIRRHDGEQGIGPLHAWWTHHPGTFRVVRNRDDQLIAFYCMSEAGLVADEVQDADPVAATWQANLTDESQISGEKTLFLRRWLHVDEGEGPCAAQAACWLDAKRAYMELRPALRRVYLAVVDLPVYGPAATQLGFQHLAAETTQIGDQNFQTAMLDFGPESVDGWITRLVGDEMGIAPESILNQERRALVLDGEETTLTPLEYHLMAFLEAQAGKTVTRDEILAAVWGNSDGSTSSNVVDAVVKTLRRKLGPHAQHLETARGFGYRWHRK